MDQSLVRQTVNASNKLKILIVVEVLLVVVHRFLRVDNDSGGVSFSEWHFLLAIGFGILVALYAFGMRCPICRARQVFRGWKLSDLRFPSERCYKCDSKL